MDAIDGKLRAIFQDIFDVSPSAFSDALSQDDIEAWDSVAHITLVLSLEEAFGVQFSPEDAESLTSVRMIRLTLEEMGRSTAGG